MGEGSDPRLEPTEQGTPLVDPAAATHAHGADSGAAPRDELIGRRLGDFVIGSQLGAGGGGSVYLAHQRSLDRQAVIKLPLQRSGASAEATQRFLREAKLASRLDHPYAAHIYAFGAERDGLFWIAMERVHGVPLDRLLAERGPFALARFVPFLERLCEVVHTAHEQGIVHRDIKPQNVMVITRAGRLMPKLLDLGIAKSRDELGVGDTGAAEVAASFTRTVGLMGSPHYMAPEQWVDAASVGPRADVYALGVLSYELLTGQPPFTGRTLTDLAHAHARESVPRLPGPLPVALHRVLARAMAKRPEERHESALELAAAIAVASGLSEAAALPQLDETIVERATLHAPQPIAESVAALAAARNVHQALEAVDVAARALIRWLGALSLAACTRSRDEQPADAREHLRRLRREGLSDAGGLELARELGRGFVEPNAHPVPELERFVAGEGMIALERLVARRSAAGAAAVDETRARQALLTCLADLATVFRSLTQLIELPAVVARHGTTESWMGLRRARRALVDVSGAIPDDHVVVVGTDGTPVLDLHPLAQARPPMPGEPAELFVIDGPAAHGARLLASPSGFEIADEAVWDWMRERLLAEADAADADTGAGERSPYPGLAAFTAADAASFVGREAESAAFLNRLRVHDILAVVGPSGAGKSSFVMAGVLSALPDGWRWLALRPSSSPLHALARAIAPEADAEATAARLAAAPDEVVALLRADDGGGKLVLFVGQFEETFTLCPDAGERRAFAEALVAAARGTGDRVRVVITLRDDFLIAAEQLPALHERLAHGLVLLAPLAPEALVRALVEPARRAGYSFDDPALPTDMVKSVSGQPGALALLSFAAARLWEQRDRHFHQLRRKSYDAMGGVSGALVRQAEDMLAGMPQAEHGLVREAFRRLVTTDDTRAVVARQELVEALGGAAGDRVIERLVASRLVVASEGHDGVVQIEIAHETLLVAWPRLAGWRREDAEGSRFREQLGDAARQWQERGRPRGLLWRDDALAELRTWRARHPFGLSAVEEAFSAASQSAQQRSVRMRRALLVSAMLVLASVAAGFYVLSVRERHSAERVESLLVESYLEQARNALAAGRPWPALVSLAEARRRGAHGAAVDVLQGIARRPARAVVYRVAADDGRLFEAALSPDGRHIAVAGTGGAAVHAADDGRLVTRLVTGTAVVDVAWSHDGRRAAAAAADGTLRVFAAQDGRALWTGAGDAARALSWSADDAQLCSIDVDKVRLWDSTTGVSRDLGKLDAVGTGCAFGGDRLAVISEGGEVGLWDATTGAAVAVGRHGGASEVHGMAMGRDLLATAGFDRTVRLWDLATGDERRVLEGARERVMSVAFSPDGAQVAAGDRGGTVLVWDVATGKLLRALAGHRGAVHHVAFDARGGRMLSASDDGSARIWDTGTGRLIAPLSGHDKAVVRAEFTADGERVVTASFDGSMVLWSLAEADQQLGSRPRAELWCAGAPVRSGGRFLAVSCRDATPVWDGRTGTLAAVLPGGDGRVAVSEDGTLAGTVDSSTQDDSRLRGYRIAGGAFSELPVPPVASPRSVAVGDGLLLIGDGGGVITMWDVAAQRPRWRSVPARHGVDAVAFVPGRDLVVTLDSAGTLRTLERDSGEVIGETSGPPPGFRPLLVFSPSGDRLVVGAAEHIDLLLVELDARRRADLRARWLRGHTAGPLSAQFSDDGAHLVTASIDGSAIVWDVVGAREEARLADISQYVADAGFAAGGELIAGIDGEGNLLLWETASGRLLGLSEGAVPGHAMLVQGNEVASLDNQGGFTRWRLPLDAAAIEVLDTELACAAPAGSSTRPCRR